MNSTHHKWTVNVAVKKVDDNDLTHTWQEACSITRTCPRGEYIYPSGVGVIVITSRSTIMAMVISSGKQETDFNTSPLIYMDAFAFQPHHSSTLWVSRRSVF
ncbi:hypothetical protein D9M73_199570 [compost metagenome]